MVLLNKGASVDATDDIGRTALHWLCTSPCELEEPQKAVFEAITRRAPHLVHKQDQNGFSPLQLAVRGWHIWAAEALLAVGADAKEQDPDGNTALHFLALQLCGESSQAAKAAERFSRFLELDVPINARNQHGETPLFNFMATSWTQKSKEEYVTHRGAFPVFAAAGADVLLRNEAGETLLHIIAKQEHKENYVGWYQRQDMVECFQDLMALGLDPRVEDNKQRTAIDVAVASDNSCIVELFRKDEEIDK
jgi:ankyrin repeat protein